MFEFNGETAIVHEKIQPGKLGRVRFQGSYWFARCEQDLTLKPGETVQVINLEKITLIVTPIPPKGRL